MEDNKIFCTNCQKEMKITDKFCIGCGTKNEQFSEEALKEIKNSKDKVENAIIESSVKDSDIKEQPRKNKKLFLSAVAVAAILLVIAFVAPNIYAMMSPTNFVKNAISDTFESFEKNGDKFTEIPTLYSLFADSNGNTQKELYLNIEDININAGMPLDTSVIEDYGVKFILQSSKDKASGKLRLALTEGQKEIVDGSVYYDKDKLALESSKLFKDILGVRIDSSLDNSDKDDEELRIMNTMDSVSKLMNSSEDLKKIYTEISSKYADRFKDLANFEKDKSDKTLYTAVIDGDKLVLVITDLITELFNDEKFKEYLADAMFISEGDYSREYYVDMIDNAVLALPDEIDYILEEVEVSDLVIDVIIDKKQMLSLDASISIKSYEEDLKIKYSMNYIDENDKHGMEYSLKIGVSSYNSIKGSVYYTKDGKDLKRNISFDIAVPEENMNMSFKSEEILKENKKYENSMFYNINDGYDDMEIKLGTKASYENDKRIDFEDIELDISVDGEEIKFNLSGYVSNSNIKSIDTLEGKKITYIEDLDEQDIDSLSNELMRNLYLLLQDFGGII